ncbi:MAG TPA: fatty acid desaturase family protein [Caulobacteraceae bacterium]|nr:fatty acid desaturase family protein [Caulobacteraceae bacterium]
MAAAARVDPKDFFTAEEWRPLAARSSWKGLALVAHGWAVIGLTWAAVILSPRLLGVFWPVTIIPAAMIIGGRQLGLAILMHDGAHGCLHPNRKVNDFVAEWLCTGGVERYRRYHLQHHKFAQQAEDPDLKLSAPFPITRTSLRRKVIRDLTGQTWFKERFGVAIYRLKARKAGEPALPILVDEVVRLRRWLIVNGLVIAVTSAFGLWWAWFALWLLPRATWFQMITRFRNICEHALIAKDEPDPLRQARTTHANILERALIAPYYVNYHCEHHMFMHLPCWSLPRVHRLLKAKGALERMRTAPGYVQVLSAAAGA